MRDAIQKKDVVVCPTCGAKNEITAICGDYREDKKKKVFDGEYLG